MVFTDQPSFQKLVTHIFTLDLETLLDLLNSVENSDDVSVCNTEENEDENELCIIFLEEDVSSDG